MSKLSTVVKTGARNLASKASRFSAKNQATNGRQVVGMKGLNLSGLTKLASGVKKIVAGGSGKKNG